MSPLAIQARRGLGRPAEHAGSVLWSATMVIGNDLSPRAAGERAGLKYLSPRLLPRSFRCLARPGSMTPVSKREHTDGRARLFVDAGRGQRAAPDFR